MKERKAKELNEEEGVVFGIPVLMKMFHYWGNQTQGKWLYYTIFLQILLNILFLMQNICQSIYSVLILPDLSEFVTSMIFVLNGFKAQIKIILPLIHESRIDSIFQSFRKCYNLYTPHCEKERQVVFQQINRFMTTFFYLYSLITGITALTWLTQTFYRAPSEKSHLYTQIEIPDFNWALHSDIWVPFPIRNRMLFGFVNGFLWFNFFWQAGSFIMTDVCYLLLFKYMDGHLQLLGVELRRSGEYSEESMERNLIRCMKYHRELLRISKQIEKVSEIDILYLCLAFTFSISFGGYLMTKLDQDTKGGPIIKLSIFLFWSLTQLYVLMNAGDKVYQQMLEQANNAYVSHWPDKKNRSLRVLIVIIIQRCRMTKPIKATHFIEITRDSFAKFMNTSFSYLTLLNNVEM